jgi:hypothetical protein
MKGSSLLMFVIWEGFIWKVKVSTDIDHAMHISGSNGPVSLYARQCKLGTIIIQIVHILQHDSADTGSLPKRDFCMVNSNYFQ